MEHYRRARSTLRGCSVVKSFKGNKIFYLRQEIAPKWQELRVKCCNKTSNGAIQVHPERSDAPHGCYRAFLASLGMFKRTAYSDSCSVFTCSSRAREYWRSDSRSVWSFFTRVSRRMISNLSFCTSMLAGEAAAGRDGGTGAGAGGAAATAGAAAAGRVNAATSGDGTTAAGIAGGGGGMRRAK